MTEVKTNSKIGACGDNCEYCHRYHATKNGNSEELEKVKELWIKLGLRNESFPSQNLACSGCKPNEFCGHKELLNCVLRNGIDNCGMCDAYPCEMVINACKKTDTWKIKVQNKCTNEEYEMLIKAFCEKKLNLDKIFMERHTINRC
jgi:hypothetical protein